MANHIKPNKQFNKKLEKNILMAARKVASEIESELKASAPWNDVTGEARDKLSVTVEETDKGIVVRASHGVAYGIYLERANFGRFAVIGPYYDNEAKNFARRVADAVKH